MLNGHREHGATFTVPEITPDQPGTVWKKIIDTGLDAPADFADLDKAKKIPVSGRVNVAPMGCVVLQGV
jgi:hypothetical protein